MKSALRLTQNVPDLDEPDKRRLAGESNTVMVRRESVEHPMLQLPIE